jgi:hypothetical protein
MTKLIHSKSGIFMIGFDEYDRKARLTPGLLAIAPVAILVVTLGLKRYAAVAVASGVVVGAGGAYLLAILVRHFGRIVEPELFASWGGRSTTRFLRLRGDNAQPVERDLWRAAVQRLTATTLLSAEQELANPALADQTIEVAVNQVLYLGQGDKRNPLVHAENIQYGFERNTWGLRWFGRVIGLLCTTSLAVVLPVGKIRGSISVASVVAGIVIELAITIGWFILPSARRVALASDRYARQLFQAVVAESQRAGTLPPTEGGPR